MPVGVQLMGQQHDDARITALARWLLETVPRAVVRCSCQRSESLMSDKERDMAEALWRASAGELVAGIRAKRFSCVEVMTSVVERIRALNPKLNAIVVERSTRALAEAAAADRALASGVEPGPLF